MYALAINKMHRLKYASNSIYHNIFLVVSFTLQFSQPEVTKLNTPTRHANKIVSFIFHSTLSIPRSSSDDDDANITLEFVWAESVAHYSPCKISERVVCIVAIGGVRSWRRRKRFVQLLRSCGGMLQWCWWLIWLRLRLIDKHMIYAARTGQLVIFCYRFDALIAALQESGHFFHNCMVHLTARFHLPFARNGIHEREREWKKTKD